MLEGFAAFSVVKLWRELRTRRAFDRCENPAMDDQHTLVQVVTAIVNREGELGTKTTHKHTRAEKITLAVLFLD